MNEITLEQLLAGAILRFGSVDKEDIRLLAEELKQHHILVTFGKSAFYLEEYIQNKEGVYSFKEGMSRDTMISLDYTLGDEMENVAGTALLNILFNMDIDLFTLKKIRNLYNPEVSLLKKNFNVREERSICNLLDGYYITKVWNGLAIYDEKQVFNITRKGEVRLFMAEHPEIMASLLEMFRALRYNTDLIPEFLATQNLETFQVYAETAFDFEYFCSMYDRDPSTKGRK